MNSIDYPTATAEELEYYRRLSKLNSQPAEPPEVAQAEALMRNAPAVTKIPAKTEKNLIAFQFPTPAHLFFALYPETELYRWQKEELFRLGGYRNPNDPNSYKPFSPNEPCLYGLLAGNGAGKDSIIISTFAVWFILKGIRNRVLITSASYEQLKRQTEPAIMRTLEKVEKLFNERLFESVEFFHFCRANKSEIKLFATNSSSRVEGYHPGRDEEQAIIVNEAKSVDQEIFAGLDRCTPYSYFIHCSSAGERKGRFYQDYISADKHENSPILTPNKFFFRTISVRLHCPHIPRSYIKRMEEVQSPAWIASSIDSQFFDIEHDLLFPPAFLEKMPETIRDSDIGIGLDTAAGGDETVVCFRRGNALIRLHGFREQDTQRAADGIINFLKSNGITPDSNYTFFADYGGPGQGTIDRMRRGGWRITAVIAQSRALQTRLFANRGIETAWHVRRLLDMQMIAKTRAITADEKLYTQLIGQKYIFDGKYRRESKDDIRARGEASPDRADAFILCFASYKRGQIVYFSENPDAATPDAAIQAAEESEYTRTIREYYKQITRYNEHRSTTFFCDRRV